METSPSDKKPPVEKKDVYLLGGKDLEMYQIEKKLRRTGKEFVNRNLAWGAVIDSYQDVVEQTLAVGDTPVAVELGGADNVPGVIDIDHHNEKFGRPASLAQVMSRIDRRMTLVDELIAANDSGYIPGMVDKMEEYRPRLVEAFGEEKFEHLKNKLIELIRAKDREMQGVTPEMERESETAIERAERGPGGLLIVWVSHNKISAVTDRLFPTWQGGRENLIVVCNANQDVKEVSYLGRGDICKEVKEHFVGWGGGRGYGNKDKNAFSGARTSDAESVINFITLRYGETT